MNINLILFNITIYNVSKYVIEEKRNHEINFDRVTYTGCNVIKENAALLCYNYFLKQSFNCLFILA